MSGRAVDAGSRVATILQGGVHRRATAVLWITSPRGLSQWALPLFPKLLRSQPSPSILFRRPVLPMLPRPRMSRKLGTGAKPAPSPHTRDRVQFGPKLLVAPEMACHTEYNRPEQTSWLHSATGAGRRNTLSSRKLQRRTWLPSPRSVCENTPEPPNRRHFVTARYSHTGAHTAKA